MNDNVFQDDQSTKNYFDELVGEGRKFKTQEDLARAKFESDQYIETMKMRMDEFRDEIDTLRADANARPALTDMIEQLKQQSRTGSDTNTPSERQAQTLP